jgi:hypothetical protein
LTSSGSERPRALAAGFGRLTEAPDGFAHADSEGGDGFETLHAGFAELRRILPAGFSEEQFGVSEDAGKRIIQFVTKELAKMLVSSEIRAGKIIDGTGGSARLERRQECSRGSTHAAASGR